MRVAETSRRSGLRHGRGGQVLAMTLLAISLLSGLVFYVYNAGSVVSRRMSLQDNADAVAVSGGAWMARSMNVVAMNNVAMSRMVALVPIMDSLPLATRMSLAEAAAWEQGLDSQIRRGVPEAYLREGLQSLRARMVVQRDVLNAMDLRINRGSFQMSHSTHWSYRGGVGVPPHGELWRAASALGEMAESTAESAGVLSQADAVRFGRENEADVAFVAPVLPRMPARKGTLRDWRTVLKESLYVTEGSATRRGGNGGAIPDWAYPHRLGPWARLLKWRDPTRMPTGREWVPPRSGPRVRGGTGNINLDGRRVGSSARTRQSGHRGHWRATGWVPTGYSTYGPYTWAMRRIHWWSRGNDYHPGQLADVYFYSYLRSLAEMKMEYMFGPVNPSLRRIHFPQWRTDYEQARQLAARADVRVSRTMVYLVEIASRVPENAPGWLSPGSYRTNGDRPIALWIDGWSDPGDWSLPRVANYIWKDQYHYEVTEDRQLGITPRVGADGRPMWQNVYMVAWYIFGGIDVGGDVEVVNPANWDPHDEPPVPILLDTSEGDYDPAAPDADNDYRRKYFSFLGIAAKSNAAATWRQRFRTRNPLGSMLAVAQAKVLNNKSFDLWTQDWQVQLTPVEQWSDWVDRLERGADDAAETRGLVNQGDVERIHKYMQALRGNLADLYVNH